MTTGVQDCDWPADFGCDPPPDATPELVAWAIRIAADLLWALSGRSLGVCTVVLDPRRTPTVCLAPYALKLAGPASEVLAVTVDHQALPTAAWRLETASSLLVRIDGCPWPTHPRIPVTVTYRRGTPLPAAGRHATGVYARELLKACAGDRTCRLPARVVSIARQGVDYQFSDPADLTDQGLTGIPEVDTWLRGANPHRHASPPRVWSPDIHPDRLTELGY